MSDVSHRNGAGESSGEELVVVRVEDAINATLAGHTSASYQSPPQPREQAMTLVWLLLGCASEPLNGDARWVAPIAGGRRTVTLHSGAVDGRAMRRRISPPGPADP